MALTGLSPFCQPGKCVLANFGPCPLTAALMVSGDYNVNQAAVMTGFNQMAHFRETFKREFGILPSEVKRGLA